LVTHEIISAQVGEQKMIRSFSITVLPNFDLKNSKHVCNSR
jgi:hypothetical protein